MKKEESIFTSIHWELNQASDILQQFSSAYDVVSNLPSSLKRLFLHLQISEIQN